jgi:hypothetical protein
MRIVWPLLFVSLSAIGCGPSDEELCKEVQEKMARCGSVGPSRCNDTLADKVREQYECIVDTRCSEIHECAD